MTWRATSTARLPPCSTSPAELLSASCTGRGCCCGNISAASRRQTPEGTTDMHDSITDQLSDYLDGELSAEESAAVEAHLRECAACNAVLNDLKRIVAQAQHL